MSEVWVREFTGGLDSRRLPETAKGGTLLVAQDGHINRGGEFEQRAAFVKAYDLPAGTKGLGYLSTQLIVFGIQPALAGMPTGVTYQQLVHPATPALYINRILSWEYFAGKIYAVAEFEDGSIYHFYDGVRVPDFDEKRARVTLTFTSGVHGASVENITINGVGVLGTAVEWAGSGAKTAQAVANQLNSYLSSPDYTAVPYEDRVAILAATHGAAFNGFLVAVTAPTIGYTLSSSSLSGGSDGAGAQATAVLTLAAGSGADTVASIKIGGVDVLGTAVAFNTDLATTASLIAQQITAYAETPEYVATAIGTDITIKAALVGSKWSALPIVISVTGGMSFTGDTETHGGVDITYQSGRFVKTGNKKLHALTESEWHFCGIQQPTQWISQNAAGAGFVDLSTEASNTEVLTSIAKYQKYEAIFSTRNVQVWFNDPDPANNAQVQVLNNTGTTSPRSVVQYGDADLFYLDESGVRSLRARDASNAAATTDIGVPIDTLVIEALQSITFDERSNIVSVVEPSSGRYWLAIKDTIFVFSYFKEASVSAWSLYKPGFTIDDIVVFNRKVHVRSGNTIYIYGGAGSTPVYDDTKPVAWLPYLDANEPWAKKTLLGVDIGCRGTWEVQVGADPVNLDASDRIGVYVDSTFVGPDMPACGESTHFGLRLTCMQGVSSTKPAVLSSVVLHFSGGKDD